MFSETRGLAIVLLLLAAGGLSPVHAQPCQNQTPIGLGAAVNGTLAAGDCTIQALFGEPDTSYVDLYRITLPGSGSLTITMTSTALDSFLVLMDETLNQVISLDDDSAGNLDARITIPTLATGTYVILANTYEGETGSYTLSTSFSATEPPDCSMRTPIGLNDTVAGTLSQTDCTEQLLLGEGNAAAVDVYEIVIPATGRLEVTMSSNDVDAVVALFSDDLSVEIARDDDSGGGPFGSDARLAVPDLPAGSYLLLATSFFTEVGDYSLTTSYLDDDLDDDGINDDVDPDDDGDGMPDVFEISSGLDPRDAADAAGDLDADGLSNLQEFQLGTLVGDPDSDGDGLADGAEVTTGRDPLVNEAAVVVSIINSLILNE